MKNLKILISFAIITLIFSMPQAIQGMETFSTANESKPSGIQLKRVADDTLEATLTPTSREIEKRRSLDIPPITTTEGVSDNPFKRCPEEIMIKIFVGIVSLDNGAIGRLPAVCKGWQSFIKQYKIDILQPAICNSFFVDEETCKRFLSGRLIYKPNKKNDIGKIEPRILDLVNPLEGTFDLSQCGGAGKYLSISTGYRKEKKAENAGKVEIWFTPRFLVERELNTTASHFKAIFPAKWPDTAPIGIFWTWGNWDNMNWYACLTTQTMEVISAYTLYEKWKTHNQFDITSHHFTPRFPSSFHSIICFFCTNFMFIL